MAANLVVAAYVCRSRCGVPGLLLMQTCLQHFPWNMTEWPCPLPGMTRSGASGHRLGTFSS